MSSPVLGLPDHWEAEGRRLADALQSVSSVLIIGADPDQSSRVAIGVAESWRGRRGVAVGDLTGFAYPLYQLAGGEDALGLSDCFREGLSMNDVARPVHGHEGLFVIPAGTPPLATEDLLRHERWEKLIGGFEQAGGLLLIIAPLGAPGLDHLESLVGGTITVDLPANRRHAFHLLGNAEPPLPPAPPEGAGRGGPRTSASRRLAIVGGLAVALVAGTVLGVRVVRSRRHAPPPAPTVAPPVAPVVPAAPDTTRLVVPSADTIPLHDPAPGPDSLLTVAYAVNVIAANTLSGANSVLRDGERATVLPAATISPVTLGGGTLWYQVMVGAYRSRADADDLLRVLRKVGVVRSDGGIVVRVPYALLLADDLPPGEAPQEVATWRAKGVQAYGLVQGNGRVRVLAGAFETPAQAAPLAAQLRQAGVPARVAFRIGRVF